MKKIRDFVEKYPWIVETFIFLLLLFIVSCFTASRLRKLAEPYKNDISETEPYSEPETLEPIRKYYDVPLTENLQEHIFLTCEDYGVDPEVIFSIIETESNYEAYTVGDNGESFGLMQIQPRWNEERMERLKCDDLLDPYQNIRVGIDLISEYNEYGKPLEFVLMAYNGGISYAFEKDRNGIITNYANTVMSKIGQLSYRN